MTVLRPQCSSIILAKELGDKMQTKYDSLYRTAIRSKAQNDSIDCDVIKLKDLLVDIYAQDPSRIDGFRIHLGLDASTLVFLFKGIVGLSNTGVFYQMASDGHSYSKVDDKTALIYTDNYASEILSLPAIINNLPEGNTKSYAYNGLLKKFGDEFQRHVAGSPVTRIKIKLSACVDNTAHPDFNDRIIVGFSFLVNNVETYMTDVPGSFGCDMPKLHPFGPGADTETPCPPTANCP